MILIRIIEAIAYIAGVFWLYSKIYDLQEEARALRRRNRKR